MKLGKNICKRVADYVREEVAGQLALSGHVDPQDVRIWSQIVRNDDETHQDLDPSCSLGGGQAVERH
jgi:hypothetical protein